MDISEGNAGVSPKAKEITLKKYFYRFFYLMEAMNKQVNLMNISHLKWK